MADANRVAIRTAKAMEAGQAELASAGQKLDVILEKLAQMEQQQAELAESVKAALSGDQSGKPAARSTKTAGA